MVGIGGWAEKFGHYTWLVTQKDNFSNIGLGCRRGRSDGGGKYHETMLRMQCRETSEGNWSRDSSVVAKEGSPVGNPAGSHGVARLAKQPNLN